MVKEATGSESSVGVRVRASPPTDFKLLRAIHDRHHRDFVEYVRGDPACRQEKILVPIDIPAIAAKFGADADSVFGRLYYHLEKQYGKTAQPGKSSKVFFTPVAGDDVNCVNFPPLEAVLAGLWQERRRDLWTWVTATLSLGIAVAALVVSLVALS